MSLRPMLWSVPSVEPILKLAGSNDAKWMEVVDAALREREAESSGPAEEAAAIRRAATELLAGTVAGPETDRHVEVVSLWANRVLPLGRFDYDADPATLDPTKPRMLTDGDWKHEAWDDYRDRVEPRLDADVAQMVQFLCVGRPLAGTRVESGWSYYAWLERAELDRLLGGLGAARGQGEAGDELDEFHEELLGWLGAARQCGALWLLAS